MCPQCDGKTRLLDYDQWQGWRYQCVEETCRAISTEDEIEEYEETRSEVAAHVRALARPTGQTWEEAQAY